MEFALIFPLFMTLILGMFTGGQAYNRKLGITQAAREGARYGATVDAAQEFSGPRDWAEGVRDVVVERSAGELTTSQVTCVALVQGPRNNPTVVPDDPAGNSHEWQPVGSEPCPFQEHATDTTDPGRRVQVAVRRPAEIQLLFFDIDLTLRAQANAQFEGD